MSRVLWIGKLFTAGTDRSGSPKHLRDERTMTTKKALKALIVSYAFPPVGGAGVQRVTKFVKYLPEFGWDSTVLTVENPSVPVLDQSLVGDVPRSTQIGRASCRERVCLAV